ncbi:helix-turn-helix transcriptional regulator [Pseudoclavibacter endophyticus]|uniref:Helix-turn-helix transcriptional regulator n=1 Tax=Pseudoclavibacter endophyticus TaxID=1778590 RepID=A0A6H9WAM3_9MICO|nr:LuxR C-terminal-related transcriptional regulator [Pseudoclavibacter endophyticus]KAB1646887.1 helix-turn-helix transcriptional regulator [Pseudoclavibacter endophyticus]GGA74691.1 helix-turn-helix transcriptional regulator [Pseudoclavibacter endophyticus]
MEPSAVGNGAHLLESAVREFARRTRFPIAFGGLVSRDTAAVTVKIGTHTNALDGLAVRRERGLGGRAMTELRPRMTGNYSTARQITHDYDSYILGEGISTLLAVPVIVHGRALGVLYGGAWGRWNIGGVTTSPAVDVARSLADELRIHDEVERRIADARASTREPGLSPTQRETVRETYAELRRIAAALPDAAVRARLAEVEQRLATLSGAVHEPLQREADVQLTPREIDVLACVALGATNAEAGQQLGLREATVKAYLGTAMSKLQASTRHAAVAQARKLGLLP